MLYHAMRPVLIRETIGLRWHLVAGRHPTVLPRTQRHRKGILGETQRASKEVL